MSFIHRIHTEENRTPTTKEAGHRLILAASKFFGSWNKTMKELGLTPNTQWLIRGKIPCKAGHTADSASEKLVADWLFDQGLSYESHKPYPEGRYTCDFYLPDQDLWVEYFGLLGQHRDYDATVEIKRDMARRHGLNLVEVTPEHLYPEMRLGGVLSSNPPSPTM